MVAIDENTYERDIGHLMSVIEWTVTSNFIQDFRVHN